jgi:signal transduction histidine kinase
MRRLRAAPGDAPDAAPAGQRLALRGRFLRLSIRQKLLGVALLPLGIALPVLALVLALWTQTAFDKLLATKVRSDLAVAQGYFDKVMGDVGASTSAVADSQALYGALERSDAAAVQALLQRCKEREQLDFMQLQDPSGRVIADDHAVAPAGRERATPDDLPQRTPGRGASIEVVSPAALAHLAPALVPRVAVPLVPTRNAQPTDRQVEDRALVILARAQVLSPGGQVLGELRGGVLLNRNLGFIDHINEIVYPEGALPFGSRGTATLFLDDVRISTNVRLFGSDEADNPQGRAAPGPPPEGASRLGSGPSSTRERAIGTRVSQAVHEMVLGRGQAWLDRAFVVSDWYVSGYQPLVNGVGERVGMLYVGFLEQPFTWIKVSVLVAITVVFGLAMLIAAWVSLRWARSISRPIERMSATMDDIAAGRLQARVGSVPNQDEIGQLAGHLDQLLGVIEDNTAALQRWGDELDRKVAERTAALQAAQQQLVRSEKLAAIGQLTASIAHEINNPIAVILGNLDVVREQLGTQLGPVQGEVDLIDEQIERMRLIVTQLLQFARPNEYAGFVDQVDCGQLLRDCLVLVNHLLARTRIRVELDLQANHQPVLNRNELQQVLVNLLVNAIHAMPEGGSLTLATRDLAPLDEASLALIAAPTSTSPPSGDDGAPALRVEISVADTGAGLTPDQAAELFQPFVTRKKDGTGLGLWISRNIVERYGGDIRVRPRADGRPGAVFVVLLR